MLMGLGLFAAILIVMILIAIPVVKHTRAENHARTCIDNLSTLLAAKERYVIDHDLKRGDKVDLNALTQGAAPLLKLLPVCPDLGTYNLGAAGELPTCSLPGHALPMLGKKQKYLFADEAKTTTSTAAGK